MRVHPSSVESRRINDGAGKFLRREGERPKGGELCPDPPPPFPSRINSGRALVADEGELGESGGGTVR